MRLTPLLPFFAVIYIGKAELVINEFLADNSGLLTTDEDGFPADWIEIHNPDPSPVNLAGYFLTDDPDRLNKWAFPSLTLQPGQYLRVFASGKNRTANSEFLHTNFSLNAGGEYLALVRPDASTIAYQFAPAFPPQFKDISYGLGETGLATTQTLVTNGTPLTYLVPTSDIGNSWQLPGFDDSAWTSATSPVGYGYDGLIGDNGDVESVMRHINSSIYLRYSFQVANPSEVSTLTLRTLIDDGFSAYLNGNIVASQNAPSPLTFNSSASTIEEVDPGEEFTDYPLDITDKLVAGENILAIQGLNSGISGNDFIFISNLVGDLVNLSPPFPLGYFSTPSPASGNGTPALAPPAEVGFDITSRAFTENFTLTLTHPDPNAVIHFTTDGNIPDQTSPIYTAPIPIQRSIGIRARAYLPSSLPGLSRTEGYMKISQTQADFSSDLPIVLLSTFGTGAPNATDSPTRKPSFMLIYQPDPVTGRTTLLGEPHIATRTGSRRRGSSSAGFPKYPISLESWDENDEDQNISPLGLSSEGDWILNSRYTFDRSLIRNAFIYGLSNQIGQWAVDTRFVELFNDTLGDEITSNDYFGVYTLMEKIEVDNDRVDIADLDPWENSPQEITGGFIFKNDRVDPDEITFDVNGFSEPLVLVDPSAQDITSTQLSYLTNYTDETNIALRASNGIHFRTGLHFSDYLDVDSFIDNFLLNTLAMNPDWGRLSQFFHKDRGGKIVAGPIWDCDRTMGSTDDRDNDPLRWEGNTTDTSLTWYSRDYEWFGLLFGLRITHDNMLNLSNPQLLTGRPDVFQKIIDRWYELRAGAFSETSMNSMIDAMAGEIQEAQARNFERWTLISDSEINGIDYAEAGTTGWESQISHLKGWLAARTEWIDDQFFGPPTFNQNGGIIAENFQLNITSPDATIYYTTDGSDPRAEGGTPSTTSSTGNNLTLDQTTTVTARSYDGQQWSAPASATFVVGALVANSGNLVISEIMYDPTGPTAAEIAAGYNDDSFFEYLEILNTSSSIVNLSEVRFADGIDFAFAGSNITELAPGERALIVRNTASFTMRYGATAATRIAGEFANQTGLSGRGEQLILTGAEGTITNVTYDNNAPWPLSPDGVGPSLVLINPGTSDPQLASNWRPSVEIGGNPSTGDATSFTGDPLANLDADELNAFAEYALGLDDSIPHDPPLLGTVDANGRYTFTYSRNLAADDAEIILEISTDLETWTLPGTILVSAGEIHNAADGTASFSFRTPVNASAMPRLFGRLLIRQR